MGIRLLILLRFLGKKFYSSIEKAGVNLDLGKNKWWGLLYHAKKD